MSTIDLRHVTDPDQAGALTTAALQEHRAALDAALADLDPQPEPDDDARYCLTAAGVLAIDMRRRGRAGYSLQVTGAAPDDPVIYNADLGAWVRIR
jgi:hypothetical protein